MTLVLTTIISSSSVTQAATLTVGTTGTEIRILQSELQTLNYDLGSVDGIYGSKTKVAVQKFQQDNHLLADGIAGPQTQEALKKATISPQEKTTTQIISTAKGFLGVPYKWGGTTPEGFDCSGFTRYVFASHNISLPRVSLDQYGVGTPVAFSDLIPGDLVFFNLTSGTQISHVGIYIGNNQFISATSSKGIAIYSFTPYWANVYVGAKRML
ncbi:NlpC/P60 family protein [Desulfosporosinus sp. Sb-LF]|uniref:C40 family peptidase n=1 Tax=Desulfosporosinus sp. Sb-LF TaxID=2560027 RepID=UPI00107F44C4|nr:NlpC/P60 family protein [Desulfosporosinus sp. Sb-LF]TGE31734.1 hydrolase [Desulfosporosinus sp. Sb-LF]